MRLGVCWDVNAQRDVCGALVMASGVGSLLPRRCFRLYAPVSIFVAVERGARHSASHCDLGVSCKPLVPAWASRGSDGRCTLECSLPWREMYVGIFVEDSGVCGGGRG